MFKILKWNRKELDKLTDEELVRGFSSGDDKCFEELYRRYSALVYGTCLKYLKAHADSHDVSMDVFESLYNKLPRQGEIQSFKVWLYHVTKNQCISFIKKKQKQPTISHDENFLAENEDFVMENEGFLTLYNEGEGTPGVDDLHAAINQLSTEQSTCIRAFYLDKRTYKEIAEQTGYPISKVKSYIQNGKRNLKNILMNIKTSI